MKKYLLPLIALTAILFASCSKSKTNDVTPAFGQDEDLVTFIFEPFNMEPIRGNNPIDVVNRLDLWITEGDNVYDFHQVRTETNSFGTFHIALNRTKTYTLYAVGHKADDEATLTDGIIAFPDDKVTHSMFYTTTFSPANTQSLECAMQRIVGMFKFTITDAIPNDVDHMRFDISESGTRFNVATFTSTNKVARIAIPSSMNPNQQTGYTTFNIFIMADEMDEIKELEISVQAVGANDAVIEQRSFSEVPIKNGWVTSYTGTFFVTTGMTINFTVGDWNLFDDYPY